MDKVIKDFLEDDSYAYGFLPLCMTTGSGKTYSSTKVISELLVVDVDTIMKAAEVAQDAKDEEGRPKNLKVFYTTNLLKNLPKEELKNRFAEAKRERYFEKYCLVLESNVDSAYRFMTSTEKRVSDLRESIPDEIKNLKEYKKLKSIMEFRKKIKGLKESEEPIRANLELAEEGFRYKLEDVLKEKFKTSKKIEAVLLNNKAWEWVSEMYPSVRIFERKVIFLSFKKLMVKIDPIFKPSFYIYNEPSLKGSFLFVDEVDATKDTIVETIIDDGIKQSQDFISFFRHLYNPLNENDFPDEFTAESEHNKGKRADRGYTGDVHTPKSNLETLRQIVLETYQTYKLSTNFKTKPGSVPVKERFLLRDNIATHSLNKEKISPWVERSDKDGYNYIVFDENPADTDNAVYIRQILNTVQGNIEYFIKWLSLSAENYEYYKKEQSKDKDEINREEALNSVLDNFGDLKPRELEYLKSAMQKHDQEIRANAENEETGKKESDDSKDKCFYDTGFTTYDFMDSNNHEMRSEIRYCDFSWTAEKFFLGLCKTFKVVGISATAELKSALGNYDMDYLKKELGGAYHELTDAERESLERQYKDSISRYDRVKITTGAVPSVPRASYSKAWWSDITQDAVKADEMYKYVIKESADVKSDDEDPSSKDSHFIEERYFRIAYAYSVFLRKGMQAFLCVLNKLPKKDDSALDTKVLDELFKMVGEAVLDAPHKPAYMVLESTGYDEDLADLRKKLADGERVFIISTYQTIGSGQNLQYRTSEEMDAANVQTNSYEWSKEMDISGIYLDNPTNLIVNLLSKTLSESDLYKYLYQVESLLAMGEIASGEALQCMKAAYESYTGNKKEYHANLYDTNSCYMYAARLLIQAVGRICRTNKKAKEITVLVSGKALEKVNHFQDKLLHPETGRPMLLNPEFIKVIELAQHYCTMSEEAIAYKKENDQKCENAFEFINNLLEENRCGWIRADIERWKALRRFVLAHPTISESEYVLLSDKEKEYVDGMYCRLLEEGNEFFYGQTDDYCSTDTSFSRDSMHMQTVSEDSARLKQLLADEGLKQLFISKGYATSFKPGKYIICPVLFNNIYKGALGEEAGRYIVSECSGIKLSEISDQYKYEVFDFACPAEDVYFDFKHWKDSYFVDRDQMLERIYDKMESVGAKAVFVVNMLENGSNTDIRVSDDNKGHFIYEVPGIMFSESGKLNMQALLNIKEAYDEFNKD